MKSRRLVTLSQLMLLLAMSGGVDAKVPGKSGPEKTQPAKVLYLKGKQPKSKQTKSKPANASKAVKTKKLKPAPAVVIASVKKKTAEAAPATRQHSERTVAKRPSAKRTPLKREAAQRAKSSRTNRVLIGKASYYSDALQGRPTASGKPYLKGKLTAAHKTLPLGSKVRVCRLHSQQCVVVVINDRGPFYKNRIIDLSRAAASKLDIIRKGEAVVSIKQIET